VPVYGSPTIPGDGIEILRGANDVSIQNGRVIDFDNGIVDEADWAAVNEIDLVAVVGVSLINASHSRLTV
jgi:hypothetical protein